MNKLTGLQEANEISAIRLVNKRQRAKVGDIFRLSPAEGIFLWGRLIERSKFFGEAFPSNLVYIYDVISPNRPAPDLLSPKNLIIGPSVVNNLGWSRGYWEIIASETIHPTDVLDDHYFVRFHGTGSPRGYDIVDEHGIIVRRAKVEFEKLSQSGFGNFNFIDWRIQQILRDRHLI
jgi:hypothetical protein